MKDLKGIDVSEWQTGIDYTTLAKNIDFVIIREGYRQTRDKMFLTHVNGFKATRTPIKGVYHFIYALDAASAKAEAESCIRNVEAAGLPKTTRIWCDFEYDTITNAQKKGVRLGAAECKLFTEIFCEAIKAAGYPTGVYTNQDYARNMYGDEFLKRYPVWYAWYNSSKPSYPCIVWQYSSKGRLPGFGENLDMDILYEEEAAAAPEPEVVYVDNGELDLSRAREPGAAAPVSDNTIKSEVEAANRVIAIAEAEEGYHEKASGANLDSKTANSGSNNYTKYNKEMHQLQPSNMDYPAQWCDCFVDWCFYKAFGADLARKVLCGNFDDYTVISSNYYKQQKRWFTSGKRGDQIFFQQASAGGICHTGIVLEVKNGRVYCIEGNKDNAVRRRDYAVGDSYIAGYGRPRYDLVVGTKSEAPSVAPTPAQPAQSGSQELNKTPLWVGRVTANLLNVRSWAGTEYPNIKSWPMLGKGNLIDVCATVYSSKNEPWYYVRIDGKIYGFVSAAYIEKV